MWRRWGLVRVAGDWVRGWGPTLTQTSCRGVSSISEKPKRDGWHPQHTGCNSWKWAVLYGLGEGVGSGGSGRLPCSVECIWAVAGAQPGATGLVISVGRCRQQCSCCEVVHQRSKWGAGRGGWGGRKWCSKVANGGGNWGQAIGQSLVKGASVTVRLAKRLSWEVRDMDVVNSWEAGCAGGGESKPLGQ